MTGARAARFVGPLAGAVVVLATCAAGVAGRVGPGSPAAQPVVDRPSPETASAPVRPDDRVERLLRTHDCWTAAAPAGAPVPEHAVVTLAGRRAAYVAADVGYGIWLDGDPGILHGFCP
jgi:hypothetical protein